MIKEDYNPLPFGGTRKSSRFSLGRRIYTGGITSSGRAKMAFSSRWPKNVYSKISGSLMFIVFYSFLVTFTTSATNREGGFAFIAFFTDISTGAGVREQ